MGTKGGHIKRLFNQIYVVGHNLPQTGKLLNCAVGKDIGPIATARNMGTSEASVRINKLPIEMSADATERVLIQFEDIPIFR